MINLGSVSFMDLLCNGSCIINFECGIRSSGFTSRLADKVDNDNGESDKNETDKGVENGFLGFFYLAGVASGSNIGGATVNYENDRDNAGYTSDVCNETINYATGIRNVSTAGVVSIGNGSEVAVTNISAAD